MQAFRSESGKISNYRKPGHIQFAASCRRNLTSKFYSFMLPPIFRINTPVRAAFSVPSRPAGWNLVLLFLGSFSRGVGGRFYAKEKRFCMWGNPKGKKDSRAPWAFCRKGRNTALWYPPPAFLLKSHPVMFKNHLQSLFFKLSAKASAIFLSLTKGCF